MVEKSLQLQPGSEHFIELSASVVSASGIQQNILPEDRNCYFPNEGNLEFYEGYTFSNCRGMISNFATGFQKVPFFSK